MKRLTSAWFLILALLNTILGRSLMSFDSFMQWQFHAHQIHTFGYDVQLPRATHIVSAIAYWPFLAATLCVVGLIIASSGRVRAELLFSSIIVLLAIECYLLFISVAAYVEPFCDIVESYSPNA